MHDSLPPLLLTGETLDAAGLAAVARRNRPVAIAPDAKTRLAAARAVVEAAIEADLPVYGLTRGLGPQVTHSLSRADMAAFSLRTLRGRAHAVGPRLPREQVRAVMAVRLNGLLKGGAGVTPALAEMLAAMLNRGLHPQLPSIGSVGASDLCVLAHLGLALAGEGEIEVDGSLLSAQEALAGGGLKPARLGPKDGLALCSASSFSAGLGGLALHDAGELWRLAQLAAAASLEGFRGNLTPHDPAATAARPAPGQPESSAHLLRILAGSALIDTATARRLQDPLSLRTVGPLNGSLLAAIRFLEPAVLAEVNGAGDNPLTVIEADTASGGRLISTANFHTPALALALETLSQAVAMAASGAVARTAKLLSPGLSGLPLGLSPRGPGNSALAPFLKIAESLLQELRHLAQPVPGDQRWAGEGVEDEITAAPQAAKKLIEALWRLRLVLGVELITAAQAAELRGGTVAPAVAAAFAALREIVPAVDEDRSLGAELERFDKELLESGALLTRAGVPPLPA
ncbi:MAG: aromatic amino acid ammonia-lyase [Kiloniellaceae bacterium]